MDTDFSDAMGEAHDRFMRQRNLEEALTASRSENARLREAIERAPHDSLCDSHIVENILDGMVGLDTIDESKCDCWKRDAPGGDK